MLLLDLTLEKPVENIAIDEALLEDAEQNDGQELLRFWEPETPLVVLGRSSPHRTEVNWNYCGQNDIPIIRRCSGGATVVGLQHCLMYSLRLDYRIRPYLRALDDAHEFVMTKMADALSSLNITTQMQGTCDLTLGDKKVSGNALRCKRNWMIYHGTMLCQDADLDIIAECLGIPNRQPEYRQQRSHREFLTCLPTDTDRLKSAIANTWNATQPALDWPTELTRELVETKYALSEWTQKV